MRPGCGGSFKFWLLWHFSTSEQRHGGVLLAVNEALASAVEFGYRHWVDRGIIASAAAYDDDTHTLNVTVTDGGRWRLGAAIPPTTVGHCPRRGRGLPLMRALADELRIVTSERGTEVSLVWTELR